MQNNRVLKQCLSQDLKCENELFTMLDSDLQGLQEGEGQSICGRDMKIL